MSDFANLFSAISERDAAQIRSQILANEFVLISVSDGDDDDDENVGALTAEIGEFDVLVVFTTEENAGTFVREMDDLFGDEEGVDGVIVEGESMLEYLPEGYGILLNPEVEEASVIDPELAAEVLSAQVD